MQELLNAGWIQGGFAFLFGIGGYFVAWRIYNAMIKCQALIHGEIIKREELLREMMSFVEAQNHIVDELVEYKSMEQFIRKEVVPLLDSKTNNE